MTGVRVGRLRRVIAVGATAASLIVAGLTATAGAEEDILASGTGVAAGHAPLVVRKHGPAEVSGPAASISAMRSGRLSCGQVITRSTTLTADVGPCSGNGIIIGADNIMLNLNGHTISGDPGPGDGNSAGVRLPMRSGVLVTGQPGGSGRTGTITGFDAGVFVNRGSNNEITNLVAHDNVGPSTEALLGDGIVLFESANNTLRKNGVTRNGPYGGISVLGNGSHYNIVEDNTVTDSTQGGEFTTSGNGIVVNAFLDEQTGRLIQGNRVLNNIILRNPGAGISNVNTQNGLVAGNTVEDNGHLQGPGNGIGFRYGADPESHLGNMRVENNVVRRNGGNGIQNVFHNEGNHFVGNIVEGNGASDRGAGILVVSEDGGFVLEGNIIRDNVGHGIHFRMTDNSVTGGSTNNRIQGNSVIGNGSMGILLNYNRVEPGNYVVSNYAVNNQNSFGDVVDGGSAFFGVPGCAGVTWDDNTYEVATPPCAGAGGTQVSVP